jgi:hypothetical protein
VSHEIEEGQLEVLGRRVVDVGDERLGIGSFRGVAEARQEGLHPAPAEPAHGGGRELVGERVAEDRRVAGDGLHGAAHQVGKIRSAGAVDQVAEVALHGEPDHHLEPLLLGGVEQPGGRDRVGAQRVDAAGRHQREVLLDHDALGELVAVLERAEGAVGDAADEEGLVSAAQELAVGPDSSRAFGEDGTGRNGQRHPISIHARGLGPP